MSTAADYQAKVLEDVGDVGANATFVVTIPETATGGTLTLGFNGQNTSALARSATPATVKAALEALGLIGDENVAVEWTEDGTWEIEFVNDLGGQPTPRITANGSSLTPSGQQVEVRLLHQGKRPYFGSKIEAMWEFRETIADDALRYLYVRLDAITQLKGLTWPQINQEESDQTRRELEAQYKHLMDMEKTTLDAIRDYVPDSNTLVSNNIRQTFAGQPAKVTPSGRDWPFGSGGNRTSIYRRWQ